MPANYKHSLPWGLREYDLQPLKAKRKVQNAVTNSRWTAGAGCGGVAIRESFVKQGSLSWVLENRVKDVHTDRDDKCPSNQWNEQGRGTETWTKLGCVQTIHVSAVLPSAVHSGSATWQEIRQLQLTMELLDILGPHSGWCREHRLEKGQGGRKDGP